MLTRTSLNMLNVGLTVDSLVAELEDVFPLTNPSHDTPTNLIMYRSGQRSVVEWIQSRINQEED
jgi:hypothetical protein